MLSFAWLLLWSILCLRVPAGSLQKLYLATAAYVGPYCAIGSIAFGKVPEVADTLHLAVRDQSRELTWDVPIRFEPPVIQLATVALAAEPPGNLSGSCAVLPDDRQRGLSHRQQ